MEEKGRIALSMNNYPTVVEFYKALGNLVDTLTNNNFEVLIQRGSVPTVFCIDYTYDPRTDYGAERHVLVTLEEEEEILNKRCGVEK